MSLQTWQETLSSIIATNTVSGTTSETILVPDYTIVYPYMYPGRTIHRITNCTLTTAASTPGTLTIRHRWGGVAGTTLAASAALALQTSQSNATVTIETWFVCQSIGTSGSILAVSNATNITGAGALTLIPATGAAATAVDTTANKALSITVQFSSSTTNAISAIQDIITAYN